MKVFAAGGTSIADDAGDRWLVRAAVLFTIAVIVHNGDHLRRGADAHSTEVFWVGGLGGIGLEVALVVLICQRHRLAPLAAGVIGAGLAAAYLKVHFLPAHSWLSDSFTSAANVSALSWAAASLEVAAALLVAATGFAVVHRRGGLAAAAQPYEGERGLGEAIADPLAFAIVLTQTFALFAFLVQRFG